MKCTFQKQQCFHCGVFGVRISTLYRGSFQFTTKLLKYFSNRFQDVIQQKLP